VSVLRGMPVVFRSVPHGSRKFRPSNDQSGSYDCDNGSKVYFPRVPGRLPMKFLERIIREVSAFVAGEAQKDDTTLVVAKLEALPV
jgi:hypothetical protein